MSERELKITLVRSVIGQTQRTRESVRSLGLHRLHQSVLRPDRPEVRGMVERVRHLVKVEELPGREGAEA
ncbi:MAG: 50S ribosomal protein L30 [Armatimonadota bacterium]|nr:50S ribosomal protein L30 [Armatimonadota bacterium]